MEGIGLEQEIDRALGTAIASFEGRFHQCDPARKPSNLTLRVGRNVPWGRISTEDPISTGLHLIPGPAVGGKSLVAIALALRLAKLNADKPVLYEVKGEDESPTLYNPHFTFLGSAAQDELASGSGYIIDSLSMDILNAVIPADCTNSIVRTQQGALDNVQLLQMLNLNEALKERSAVMVATASLTDFPSLLRMEGRVAGIMYPCVHEGQLAVVLRQRLTGRSAGELVSLSKAEVEEATNIRGQDFLPKAFEELLERLPDAGNAVDFYQAKKPNAGGNMGYPHAFPPPGISDMAPTMYTPIGAK